MLEIAPSTYGVEVTGGIPTEAVNRLQDNFTSPKPRRRLKHTEQVAETAPVGFEELLKQILARQHAAKEAAAKADDIKNPGSYKKWLADLAERKKLVGPARW